MHGRLIGSRQRVIPTTPVPTLPSPSTNLRQQCLEKFANYVYKPGVKYCETVFDSYLCWGPTPAGSEAKQPCPAVRLSDTKSMAFRLCGESGSWLGRRLNDTTTTPTGWTNYTPCFPTVVKNLFDKVDDENAQAKFDIAQRTRYLEIFGFSVSFVALITSIIILSCFRSLRNCRTKIHMNLFCAMLLQVVLRLILYIDQALIRNSLDDQSAYAEASVIGIDNMPYLCEIAYALLEYSITETFIWMFIEGQYLNNLVSSRYLNQTIPFKVYFIVGWSLPLIITLIWAAVTGMHYKDGAAGHCWYGYNFLSKYWIVQGPRLGTILVNFWFLLSILRVLITKMRRSNSTELDRIRWSCFLHANMLPAGMCETCLISYNDPLAVAARQTIHLRRKSRERYIATALRAAFFLLPLLGITNILDMTEPPLDGSVWLFAVWSYSTHFLRSFQGFFIALLYCFCNSEVGEVLQKSYENYKAKRETRRRQNETRRNGTHANTNRTRRVKTRSVSTQSKDQRRPFSWARGTFRPHTLAELEISLPITYESRRSIGTETRPGLDMSRPGLDMSRPSLDMSRPTSAVAHHRQCVVHIETNETEYDRATALREYSCCGEPSTSSYRPQFAETST